MIQFSTHKEKTENALRESARAYTMLISTSRLYITLEGGKTICSRIARNCRDIYNLSSILYCIVMLLLLDLFVD